MSVYIVSQLTIYDREEYSKYEAGFMDVFAKFNGKMLSVDEEPMILSGEFRATRSVLIEFPDKKSALTWMGSKEYRAISKHRVAASFASSILVNGDNPLTKGE